MLKISSMKVFFYMSIATTFILTSCANKKDIYYLQDAQSIDNGQIIYQSPTIQPNDILKITVGSLEPETVIPYNRLVGENNNQNVLMMQLNGYLVDINHMIDFPVLGKILTYNLSTTQLAKKIKDKLIQDGHLMNPDINVRIINAKVTILGEVIQPGTYNFTEENITLMQAIGYAGDLTINGKRNDILITREVDGVRQVTHVDLTSSIFMNSTFYFVKPNDLIIVNPNEPKVKSAGFVGNVGTVATVISLVLSLTILLTTR